MLELQPINAELVIPTEVKDVVLRRSGPQDAAAQWALIAHDPSHFTRMGEDWVKKYRTVEALQHKLALPTDKPGGRILACGRMESWWALMGIVFPSTIPT
jgi:hypothetical protein